MCIRIAVLALSLFQAVTMSAYADFMKAENSLPKDTIASMQFVPVPSGCFQMGNTFADVYYMEIPVHEVCVSDFSIGRFDVTRSDFSKFVDETGYRTDAE